MKDAADWRLRAEIHAHSGEWDKAAEDAREYLKRNPLKRAFLLDYWAIGPYPEDSGAIVTGPEISPDLPDARDGVASPPTGALRIWQPVALNARGFVDLGPLFANAEHISAYVLLRLYSPVKRQVTIRLGSDDYVRLWLNGNPIYEYSRERIAIPDEDSTPATLEAGWNRLLARVVNVAGEHALYLRIPDRPAEEVRARP